MASIRQIAQDPHKALKDLENELGVQPGALLREMGQLAGKGGDWAKHLPYLIAESYYENASSRAQYEGHVEGCEYCKTLLQTLHPSDPEVRDFTQQAVSGVKEKREQNARRSLPAFWVPPAAAASVALTAVAVPQLQREGVFPSAARERQLIAIERAARRLKKLESAPSSKNPAGYLETAEVQAKLGLHNDALKSIQRYLVARDADPKVVAEFSDATSSKASTVIGTVR